MKYYDYNRILNEDTKYNLVIAPRCSGKTVGAIKILINRYLNSEEIQYIDSKYDFLKQSDYIEKIIKDTFPEISVFVKYSGVYIKRKYEIGYNLAIAINCNNKRHIYYSPDYVYIEELYVNYEEGTKIIDEYVEAGAQKIIIALNKSDIEKCPYLDEYFPWLDDFEGFKVVCDKENYTIDFVKNED